MNYNKLMQALSFMEMEKTKGGSTFKKIQKLLNQEVTAHNTAEIEAFIESKNPKPWK